MKSYLSLLLTTLLLHSCGKISSRSETKDVFSNPLRKDLTDPLVKYIGGNSCSDMKPHPRHEDNTPQQKYFVSQEHHEGIINAIEHAFSGKLDAPVYFPSYDGCRSINNEKSFLKGLNRELKDIDNGLIAIRPDGVVLKTEPWVVVDSNDLVETSCGNVKWRDGHRDSSQDGFWKLLILNDFRSHEKHPAGSLLLTESYDVPGDRSTRRYIVVGFFIGFDNYLGEKGYAYAVPIGHLKGIFEITSKSDPAIKPIDFCGNRTHWKG